MSQRDVLQHSVAYWEQQDQVVWVDVEHRRLQGFDTYWITSDTYGVCNDADNANMYEGRMRFSWSIIDGLEVEVEVEAIPDNAVVYRGFMLSDDDARAVGLL